jgi:glycosyltransferase involved in cell wall biosynthesis
MARILLVNLEGRIGGAERSMLLLAKHLRTDFEICVACPGANPLSAALSAIQTDSHQLPGPPKHRYCSILSLWYWLKTICHLITITLKVRPDIIHANSFYAGVASVMVAVATRRKLIVHARDMANSKFLSKLCGRSSNKIIAVSHVVKNSLVDNGINPEKIRVVYNGIEPSSYRTTEPVPRSKFPFVFANVGQFVPWKNQINFLKAAALVSRRLPEARFMLVGDDIFEHNRNYKHSLLEYAKNSPIASKIEFVGWHDDMNELWSEIDCLVHTASREPFGRVITEAMANKIPVIATDSGGPGEIIQNDKTGILVKDGDIEGLSEAMVKIATDNDLAAGLVDAGYEQVISNFTADKTAELVKEIYEEVLTT